MKKVKEASEILARSQSSSSDDIPLWFDGKSINEVEFCKWFREKYPLKYVDGRFYSIDGFISFEDLEALILEEIEPYVTKSIATRVAGIRDALKYYVKAEKLPLHEDRIHFANGTYFLDGGFIPEKEFCANRLPINYNADAKKPEKWLEFMGELLHEEDILTLQEFMGYCLVPTTRAQAMLLVLGNGGEGKSRIGVVLSSMLGDNLNFCPVDRLANDKFCPAEQMGKLLMIDDDLKMSALENTGILKQIITMEGKMSLEQKNKQGFQGIMYVRIIAFGNGALAALYDKSDGFYRRQIVLIVKDKPADRIDDRGFSEKLVAETEGITLWAIEGLKRLAKNGYHFTISERAKKTLEDSREESDNIISFFKSEGYVGFDKDSTATTAEIYDTYLEWCRDNAEIHRNINSFSKTLKTNAEKLGLVYVKNLEDREGRRVRGYQGIYIKVKNSENPFWNSKAS